MKRRGEAGFATVMVLAAVVLVGALLVTFNLWVRWAVQGAVVRKEAVETRDLIRYGMGQAFEQLLTDTDPDVDWLGEHWAREMRFEIEAGLVLVVSISDEGSKLGVNWMDATLWAQATGGHEELITRIVAHREQRKGFARSAEVFEVWTDRSANASALLDRVTVYSPVNVLSTDTATLTLFWSSLGIDLNRATQIAEDIVAYRGLHDLESIDQLLQASPALTRDLVNRSRRWLAVQGPINVNTALPEVLNAVLRAAGYGEDIASRILNRRRTQPLRTVTELGLLLGDHAESDSGGRHSALFSVTSSFFRVNSRIDGQPSVAEAIVHRQWDEHNRSWQLEIIAWSEGESGNAR